MIIWWLLAVGSAGRGYVSINVLLLAVWDGVGLGAVSNVLLLAWVGVVLGGRVGGWVGGFHRGFIFILLFVWSP